jgi:glycyl-tRNA synthetase
MPLSFQELILALQQFWTRRGCLLSQPYGVEVGAGTMNPDTFFRVLGPEPWAVAYVEPSRRPADARYGDNPFRLYKHYQFQVILKPSPPDVQEVYLQSLRAFGIDPRRHDVRFEEDNWESPTLGAQGVGWQVLLDGMEITQFTYFQQAGGLECSPVAAEITYGIERICMFLNDADSIFDLPWNERLRYRDVRHREEWEYSKYAFESADVAALGEQFNRSEAEARRLVAAGLVLPAYDACLRCSHFFNLLDSRGAVSVTERAGYILRVRRLACASAEAYLKQRQEAGFPLGAVAPPVSVTLPKPRLRARARNDFLLEVGCEEIPASMIPGARQALAEALQKALSAHGLSATRAHTFSTPRRLAVWLAGLPPRQEDRSDVVTGPPARVAYDASGEPTQAALGFARGHGIDVGSLERIQTPKGEYVGFRREVRGRGTPEILQEAVPEVLRGLSFPKTMRWESQPLSFVRPIRWLVALWNDQVVPLVFAGVRAGRHTFGHRFAGRPRLELRAARDYARTLRSRGSVWVEDRARRTRILAGLRRQAASARGALLEDEATLEEVTHLVEYPNVIGGGFDPEFLALPREVLVATMRHHQKYFGVTDRRGGSLLPRFVAVVDQRADRGGLIRRGNERVLRARLADARFFWTEDRRLRLEERTPRLRSVLFHEKLGTLAQRVERMQALAAEVAGHLPQLDAGSLARAVGLAKLDLSTEMVKEFPELQGVVGGLYAAEQGERPEVCEAIYDQYRPVSLEDDPPRSALGCALSIADRLDTLAGLFAVGEAPTGSRDPFALRRSTQGLVKIMLSRGLHLPLDGLLEKAMDIVVGQGVRLPSPEPERLQAALEFLRGRVRFLLAQAGQRYDLINAALAAGTLDPLDVRLRVAALESLKEDANFTAISISFKRIRKILAQAAEDGPVDSALLRESAERALYERMMKARERLAELVERRDYAEALRTLAALRAPIDLFFDEILVMDRDPAVRRNRVGLLRALAALFLSLADFSEVVLEGEAAA